MNSMFTLDLTIKADKTLVQAMMPELRKEREDRSQTTLTETQKGLDVHVEAEDAVALQASINGVLNMVRVYQKVKEATQQ